MTDFEDQYDRDDELEQALRSALRPLPPPAGFAERTIERSQEMPTSGSSPFRQRFDFHPMLRWAVAAILLVAIGLGGFEFYQRKQRLMAGERARDQVMLALRITGITIQAVREQVSKDNQNNGPQQERP